jgi:DNA (cytosine-5)-methyltransferase 1
MNHASLFSGIGGFDLAAEWTGWNNVFNCEWEEFPRKVLKHHFPNAKQYEDIKDFNATEYRGRIDVLSGGFPCQPFSVAGLRKGTEDSRYLWPQMLRVIGECQPRWVVGENVRGLVSWAGKDGRVGMVFETCCTDLEALGYSVQSFIIPACATNAPHERARVWIIAYSDNTRRSDGHGQVQSTNGEVRQRDDRSEFSDSDSRNAPDSKRIRLEYTEKPRSLEECEGETRLDVAEPIETNGERGNAPDTVCEGFRKCEGGKSTRAKGQPDGHLTEYGQARNAPDTDSGRCKRSIPTGVYDKQKREIRQDREAVKYISQDRDGVQFENFPTVPPICGGDDGLPEELDGITFSKWRRESIKAYGNAIVPQVAHRIFQSISDYESSKQIHK